MLTPEFSVRSLRSMISWSDKRKFGVLKEKHLRDHYLASIEGRIADNTFKFDSLQTLRIGSFQAYQPIRLGDTLVLRKINRIVRNLYSARQSDRNAIVHQAKILLEENCPKYVYKLDISKFYESINRRYLLSRLRDDNLLSSTSLNLVSILFENFAKYMKFGLPRGLAFSSTLSEIYLQHLDKSIAAMDGVYYYARYVDDMLIFSSEPKPNITTDIQTLLPGKMRLNLAKCYPYYIGCQCSPECTCGKPQCLCKEKCKCIVDVAININYLGYKLITAKVPPKDSKKRAKVAVEMADSKVNRLKTRMVKAFLDHRGLQDYDLLYNRIKFLAENHRIKMPGRRGKLMSGIHFNYPLVSDPQSFRKIDSFLRAQVYAANNSYGIKQALSLSAAEKSEMAKLSFFSGFKNRRSRSVKPAMLKKIRKCW
jgi:hypothetical protein